MFKNSSSKTESSRLLSDSSIQGRGSNTAFGSNSIATNRNDALGRAPQAYGRDKQTTGGAFRGLEVDVQRASSGWSWSLWGSRSASVFDSKQSLITDYHREIIPILDGKDPDDRLDAVPMKACRPLGGRKLSCKVKCGIISAFLFLLGLILGLIAFYVIIPSYVRQRLGDASLAFESLNMTQPWWPDGSHDNYGFTMVSIAVLSGLSPLAGTLHGMPTSQPHSRVVHC